MANIYSASLDGSTDAFSAVDHADLKPTGAFTIGVWLKTTSNAAYQMVFTSFNSAQNMGIELRVQTNNIRLGLNGSFLTGAVVNDGNWHWVVVTYDTTNATFYLDGAYSTSAALSAPAYYSTNYVRIGARDDGLYFNGNLDEVFLINGTAWDATKVTAMYKKYLTGETNLKAYYQLENNGNDSTVGAHTLTGIGTPTFAADVPFTYDDEPPSGVTGYSYFM
jgi:hypothetical protein